MLAVSAPSLRKRLIYCRIHKKHKTHNTMHTKQFYEAPEAELLVVRFEERILDGSLTGYGAAGKSGGVMDANDYGDDDDDLF